MSLFKRRSGDGKILKYLLPYGYMRRRLARKYRLSVEGGEFVKKSGTVAVRRSFSAEDLLPLGFVMARQADDAARMRELRRVIEASVRRNADERVKKLSAAMELKVAALHKDAIKTRTRFDAFRDKANEEIERLSVENLRLRLELRQLSRRQA